MTKKFVLGVAVVALVMIITAPAASAACAADKSATTGYSYWTDPADPAGTGTLVGESWQVGAPGSWSTAPGAGGVADCNTVDQGSGSPGFWYWNAAHQVGLNLHMGSCGTGCPSPLGNNTVAFKVTNYHTDGTTSVAIGSATEDIFGANNYNLEAGAFAPGFSLNLAPLRLNVNSSGPRAANNLPMNVSIPGINGSIHGPGLSSAITGFVVKGAFSAASPGNLLSAYPLTIATFPSAGGASVSNQAVNVDVSGATAGQDLWLTVQVNGEFPGNSATPPRRVHVSGALADPQYKNVPKGKAVGHTQN